MKRKMKWISMASLGFLATAVCGVFAQANVQTVSATDATNPAPITSVEQVEGHFQMKPTASVRKKAGESGIRFGATVSKAWYDLATADGATVVFYTTVNKYGNSDENEALEIEATETAEFKASFEAGATECEFTGAIIYDELASEEQIAAYNLQLEAEAYAVITKAGEDPITVKADGNAVRSIAEVADDIIRTPEEWAKYKPAEQTLIQGYRCLNNAEVYIDKANGTFDVSSVIANANVLKVKMNDENDTYVAGVYNFDDEITTAASESGALVYTDLGIIETKFNVCTKVLKTSSDFSVFAETGALKGYYYLANNIDDYGKVAHFKSPSSSSCFSGVFDGGGHYANLTVGTNRGLFVYLNAATIKNVQFNLKINPNVSTSTNYINIPGLASGVWNGVNITDTYIKVVDILNLNGGTFAPIATTMYKVAVFTRTVIEMPNAEYFTANSLDESKISALANSVATFTLTTGVEAADLNGNLGSEIFVISHLPLARNIQNNYNSAAFTVYAPNVSKVIDETNKITYYGQKEKTNGRQVYSYNTVDLLKSANHTYTSAWTSAYWDTSSGCPVFVGK